MKIRRLTIHLVLIAFCLLALYPILWMANSSLRPTSDIFTHLGLGVTGLTFQNYPDGWNGLGYSFGRFFLQSTVVSALSVIGNVVSCSFVAFAFARLRFRFKRLAFALMMVSVMLPLHVLIVPQYIMWSKAGLVGTTVPLILPKFFAADAFFVFLFTQFIRGLPRDLDNAAIIDGCNYFQVYVRIIFPLLKPAIATAALFTFIWTWNDFFTALIYLTTPANYTVPVALQNFMNSNGASDWGPMFAMSTLSIIPLVVVFALGQKHLVSGIATTGIR